ncbi:MAG: XRE family transcriptional regulator [Polyangiaceae bacterium]
MKTPDISPAILGQRLQQARKASGYTQQQVAERLSVARTTIVAIEKGERQPRPDEVVALAALYRQSVSELLRRQEPLQTVSLQFRGEIAPEHRAKLEMRCLQHAEDYVFLESLRGARMHALLPPELPIGSNPKRDGRLAAEDERRRLGLGEAPIASLRDLLEERLGVRFFLLFGLEDRRISGVYFHERTAGPVVCINMQHHWHRRRWTAAHELGHALSSRFKTEVLTDDNESRAMPRRSAEEVFADSFARCLLIPTAAVERMVRARKQERNGKFLVSDIDEFAHTYGVSFEAMCRTLEEEELVRSGTSEFVRSQGYKSEPTATESAVFASDAANSATSYRFQRLAIEAFLDHQISEGALARLLRMDRIDARDLVHRFLDDQERNASDAIARKDIS